MLNKQEALTLLAREVVPAFGCTEPVAVALAAAAAADAVAGTEDAAVKSVHVTVNPGVYKNGMGVGIPGFDKVGLTYAAALGAYLRNPGKGLELLEDIDDTVRAGAYALVDAGAAIADIKRDETALYCRAEVVTDKGTGVALIRGSHGNIVRVERDGRVLLDKECESASGAANPLYEKLKSMRVRDIRALVESMNGEELALMLRGRDLNTKMADADTGSSRITPALQAFSGSDVWGESLQSRIMMRTAACAENRMSGLPMAVMSSAGSGNHGIMAIIPLVELAAWHTIDDERLKKALAISHLLNVYIKQFTGRLSALCGCGVAAAAAVSAAMVWLLEGDDDAMDGAIINMAANVTGIICDGGKVGCALKLATSASAALMSAQLALKGVVIAATDGIAESTAEDAIRAMGKVSSPGMLETDKVILDIMLEKEQHAGCNG